jgi:hypothetical protein
MRVHAEEEFPMRDADDAPTRPTAVTPVFPDQPVSRDHDLGTAPIGVAEPHNREDAAPTVTANEDAANEDRAREDAANHDAANEDAANEDALREDAAREDAIRDEEVPGKEVPGDEVQDEGVPGAEVRDEEVSGKEAPDEALRYEAVPAEDVSAVAPASSESEITELPQTRTDGEPKTDIESVYAAAEGAPNEAPTDEAAPDEVAFAEVAPAEAAPDEAAPVEGQPEEARPTGVEPDAPVAGSPPEAAEPVGGFAPGDVPVAPVADLWPADVAGGLRVRWREIQLRFLDDPHSAAAEADFLVGEAIETLNASLASLRGDLAGWRSTGGRDTEELRVAVQRYREFLERVLGL